MSATGVHILFAPGTRPCREDILKFVASKQNIAISHDPGRAVANSDDIDWLELLRDGLTFDLRGFAPGPVEPTPKPETSFDFPDAELVEGYEGVLLAPGPHLAGSEYALPVVRGLMALACDLLQHSENVAGIVWPPSQSVIGSRYFESSVSAWLEGGPFPALGLTAFTETQDGGLQSVGLAHFIDRELRIEPPLSQDKVAATRLGIRLINQLVLMGGIEGEERVVAPDGTQLILRQSDDQRFIRVWTD